MLPGVVLENEASRGIFVLAESVVASDEKQPRPSVREVS